MISSNMNYALIYLLQNYRITTILLSKGKCWWGGIQHFNNYKLILQFYAFNAKETSYKGNKRSPCSHILFLFDRKS